MTQIELLKRDIQSVPPRRQYIAADIYATDNYIMNQSEKMITWTNAVVPVIWQDKSFAAFPKESSKPTDPLSGRAFTKREPSNSAAKLQSAASRRMTS